MLLARNEALYDESARKSQYASEPLGGYSNAHLKERFEEYKKFYSGDVEIRLAAEYMLDNLFTERLRAGDLLLHGEKYVLVESSIAAPPYTQNSSPPQWRISVSRSSSMAV